MLENGLLVASGVMELHEATVSIGQVRTYADRLFKVTPFEPAFTILGRFRRLPHM